MEEDKKERRRKLGLPEELTEEEKAKEQAKKQAKMQEEAERLKKHVAYAKPVGITEKLRGLLVTMKQSSGAFPQIKIACLSVVTDEAPFKAACNVLLKYIGNVVKHPDEDKFRHIRLGNVAFQQKVASMPGGIEFLNSCGFHQAGEFLVMLREDVNIETLNAAGTVIDSAMNNPFFGSL